MSRYLQGRFKSKDERFRESILPRKVSNNRETKRLNPVSKIMDRELKTVFEKLKHKECGTEKITQCLEITDVTKQGDAADCLEKILHKVSPKASEVFKGELLYTTKCSEGHTIIEEKYPFWTLPLSLKETNESTYSVENNFKMTFKTTAFSGNNRVYCNECQRKTEATSDCDIKEYPRILIILLKRFEFDDNTMSYFKSDRLVKVPHVLQKKNRKYKLYGMVNHMGSLRVGHYTATILSYEDNTWYLYNDTHVRKVTEDLFANDGIHNSTTAYLLMYRASKSSRVKQTGEMDGGRNTDGHVSNKEANKTRSRETYEEDGKKSRNQENPGHTRQEKWKDAQPSIRQQGHGEESDAKRNKRVSRLYSDVAEEEIPPNKKLNSDYSRKQHEDSWTVTRKQWGQNDNDMNLPQSRGWIDKIKKNPICIPVIISVSLVVLLIVIISTILATQGNP